MQRKPEQPWHTLEAQDVLNFLETPSSGGLSGISARERLEIYGENAIAEKAPPSLFVIFLRQFTNPLVFVLVIVGVLAFIIGEHSDALIVGIVLVVNAVIGVYQEGRSQNALAALKKFSSAQSLVERDGSVVVVDSSQLVPGDILLLQSGDKIPADGRIIKIEELLVDEAALTGESQSVAKTSDALDDASLATTDQINMVFKGTYVLAGNARVVITETGINTALGALSQKLVAIDEEMPLKRNIRHLSRLLIIGVAVVAAVVFLIGLGQGNSAREMLFVTIALFVSVIPEGLPVVLTLILAHGVKQMSQRQVLVKRLQAVEALGQANILAVDKTGTLTKNELVIQQVFTNHRTMAITGVGYDNVGKLQENGSTQAEMEAPSAYYLARLCALSANARVFRDQDSDQVKIVGDPTEAAFLIFAEKLGFIKTKMLESMPLMDELPFSHERKYYANTHRNGDHDLMVVTGAPESVLPLCSQIMDGQDTAKLSTEVRETLKEKVKTMSAEGLRVLVVATKKFTEGKITPENVNDLTFVGLCGMKDALRVTAIDSVQKVQKAGLRVIMITGDHADTATAIAKEAGIITGNDATLSGHELDTMDDATLDQVAPGVAVYARVTPDHKLRIVETYKRLGKTIAMTGDGVNDVPPLLAAHLGVAMGQVGTEVTKASADIILLDDNFGNIPEAVSEGRHIVNTIRTTLLYLFSTNLAEVILILAALILGLPVPLLAAQILWLNLVTDGFLPLALTTEPRDPAILKQTFKRPGKFLLRRKDFWRMLMMSSTMAVGTLIVFGQYAEVDFVKATTIALTTMTAYQWFNIWNSRHEYKSAFNPKSWWTNVYLIGATILAILLQVGAVYVPFMQRILHTTGLELRDWILALAVGFSVIIVDEVRKFFVRSRLRKQSSE